VTNKTAFQWEAIIHNTKSLMWLSKSQKFKEITLLLNMKDRSHIMDDSLEKGGRDGEWERERERKVSQNVCLVQKCFPPAYGEPSTYSTVEHVKHFKELDFAELQ